MEELKKELDEDSIDFDLIQKALRELTRQAAEKDQGRIFEAIKKGFGYTVYGMLG